MADAHSETESSDRQRGGPGVPVPASDLAPSLDPAAEPLLAGAIVHDDLDPNQSTLGPDAEPEADDDVLIDHDPGRPHRVGAWVAVVGVLALAAFFVAVPAHAYDLDFRGRVIPETRRIDLIELWRVQTRNLPAVHYQIVFQILYAVWAIAFLVGSAVLVWLAMVEIRPSAPPAGPQRRVADASSEPTPAD
jgi:hypothetical protein